MESFTGELIAVIARKDGTKEKWVVTSPEEQFTLEEIKILSILSNSVLIWK
ncbi:hypothetical protein [Listeria seeligeri]|uniref:hypothetical protein n=1 Tax=Listeria seeligeri TaxID=1640 RepID=UPI0021AB88A8|nr:hypothetical protein [Listeria seeligeri]